MSPPEVRDDRHHLSQPRLRHVWRHAFKLIGRRTIPEYMLDAICGHVPATEGRAYGPAEVTDMAEGLKRFPRYEV